MNPDLTPLLNEWPHEPGHISVRIVEGLDGEPRLQVRIDLGILQMFLDGRPDGTRPEGAESLLDALQARVDDAEDDEPFEIAEDEARLLREEAAQYYHRYMALLVLEDYNRVVRDTTRNLRVLDFCETYGSTEHDRTVLDQFRPYILMMRARALAGRAVQDDEPKAALLAIDEGLEALRKHYAEQGHPEAFEQAGETQMLRSMRDSLVPKLPVSQKAELKERIQEAIKKENYELAAILRDELRSLKD